VQVTSAKASSRDGYFDTLRAVAIVRVVAYHAFNYAVLALIFPSMGVMFALGGSLMASSLDRGAAAKVIRGRVRRLLPALWVMGIILVPLMVFAGWEHHGPPPWPRLLLWVVPLATPPASHNIGNVGAEGAGVLWYLATYLWMVLLSPLLLKAYRKQRILMVVLPLVALALLHNMPLATGSNAVRTAGYVLTFLPCWLLGFAHRDGDLRKLRPWLVVVLAAICTLPSLFYVITRHGPLGLDLVPYPFVHALYSMGFVLALLRISPPMDWLARVPLLQRLVAALNNRAVTIYLWHNVVITIAILIGDHLELWGLHQGAVIYLTFSAIALGLLLVAVLALGWVEDLAAKRRPRLRPWPVTRDRPAPRHALSAREAREAREPRASVTSR
jgi:peptidoglycan/LPS O-acetylase OafA/YrhL